MEEVNGFKEQIKPSPDNSTYVSQTRSSKSSKGKQKAWFGPCKHYGFRNYLLEDCYDKPECSTCQSTDHLTKEHPEQVVVKKTLAKFKAQSSQASSSKRLLRFQNLSYHIFIVKRHRKTTYDVFIGISLDVSYFYVFGCPMFIHNHKDHMGKFNQKTDDEFFLGYSLVAKAFRVFNIRRQEMEEIYQATIGKDDEEISQTNTEGYEINFNEKSSFLDDEFLVPRSKTPQCSRNDYFPYVPAFDPFSTNNITIPDPIALTVQDINSPDESPKYSIANDHPIHHEPDDVDPAEVHNDSSDS
nr:retrovirus-related Pol polyprotein from transposon TNT 1-94 [Tanacetum cinerariifolium]